MPERTPLSLLEDELARVEKELRARVQSETSIFPELASYALFAGGKRVRPALFLLARRMVAEQQGEAAALDISIPVAAVFELIHAASILHDDVIDEANLRRGRTAVNVYWGNKKCILLGDYLFLKSITSLVEERQLEVLPIILQTITAMIEGEGREVDLKYRLDVTEADCLTIAELKTAILFANSARIGAKLGGGSEAQIELFARFGMTLGIAFQLVDDVLDYTGNTSELGKNALNDFEEGKPTVPLVHTLSQCTPKERTFLGDLFLDKEAHAARRSNAEAIRDLLRKYDAYEYTLGRADDFLAEGRQCLAEFPESASKQAILEVADFVLARQS